MIRTVSELSEGVDKLRESGLQRGDLTGFDCLDKLYSLKQGSVTVVQGSPTHGKSEFLFELALNQAEKYGKKVAVNSPETGSVEEIVLELISKYLKKEVYKTSGFACDDKEYNKAKNWIDHHFVFFGDEETYSITEMFAEIDEFELKYGVEISIIIGEPYNELKHNMSEYGNRQDIYIEAFMTEIRKYCKTKNKHFLLSIHPGVQALQKDPVTGIQFYPMPRAREAAGGQAMFRKAMSWINIWRPPVGMIDVENNVPFVEGQLIVVVEKSKPKGIGMKGQCRLNFDWRKNRYFEDIDGFPAYAFEHTKNTKTYTQSTMPISTSFNEDAPF